MTIAPPGVADRGLEILPAPNRHSFHVVTRCRVDATADELTAIMTDVDCLTSWWPAAFLRAETLRRGRPDQVGRVLRFHTKGLLPHTFQFVAHVEHADLPHLHRSRITGDFEGTTTIRTRATERGHDLTFDWQIEVRKKGLRQLTPLIRWLLIANHLYAMRAGARGLQYELTRRRVAHGLASPALPPPRPTFPHNIAAVRRLYRWHDRVRRPILPPAASALDRVRSVPPTP